jgi:hypothetical protein
MIVILTQSNHYFYQFSYKYKHVVYSMDNSLDVYLMNKVGSRFNDLTNDKFYI